MKFFGRKRPSHAAAAEAAVETEPTNVREHFVQQPVPTQRMWLAIQHEAAAGLNVFARHTAVPDVPADVVLQARKAPLELDWSLSPDQARELAARLLEAAAHCGKIESVSYTLHWD